MKFYKKVISGGNAQTKFMKHFIAAALCVICAMPILKNNYHVTFVKDGFFGCNLYAQEFQYVIIKSEKELNGYLKNILTEFHNSDMPQERFVAFSEEAKNFYSKYDSKFFTKQNLILAKIDSGSGSVHYSLSKIEQKDKTLIVKVNRKSPMMVTMDYRHWFMMLELDKTIDVKQVDIILIQS